MRVQYKALPLPKLHPAFPQETSVWAPILQVKLDYPARHSPPTRRFEAYVDSGSPDCYFHASIGKAIGIRIEDGIESSVGGIVATGNAPTFFHEVGLHVGADILRIKAGFCERLSVAGILGRRGFFENFIVTFDQSEVPPIFEVQRIVRT